VNTFSFRQIRFFWIPLIAVITNVAGILITISDPVGQKLIAMIGNPNTIYIDCLVSSVLAVIVSEYSLRLFRFLQRFYSITHDLHRLIAIHVAILFVVCTTLLMGYQFLMYDASSPEVQFYIKTTFLNTIVITLALTALTVGMELFNHLHTAREEAEQFRRTALIAQNEALRQQLDPHFLFNNLNTLSALIEEEPQSAIRFVDEFADVYRYVLHNRSQDVVSLKEELALCQSYLYLASIRFGENIRVEQDIPEEYQRYVLPPLTLQLLLENAIKHNVITRNQPLSIALHIHNHDGLVWLQVQNSLHRIRTHAHEDSTKLGLTALQKRYAVLQFPLPVVTETQDSFSVSVPLMADESHIAKHTREQEGI
jgi:two-component system, LytTR family, sensor kinase